MLTIHELRWSQKPRSPWRQSRLTVNYLNKVAHRFEVLSIHHNGPRSPSEPYSLPDFQCVHPPTFLGIRADHELACHLVVVLVLAIITLCETLAPAAPWLDVAYRRIQLSMRVSKT